jgi:hypothetical protein
MPSVRSLIVRPKCPTQGPIGQPLVPDPRSSVDRTGIRALGPRCWNYARERRSPASGTSGGLNCLVGGTPGPSRRGPGRRPAAGAPILRDPAPDPRARRTRRLALRSSPDGLAGVRTRPTAFGRAGQRPSGGPATGLREGRPPASGRARPSAWWRRCRAGRPLACGGRAAILFAPPSRSRAAVGSGTYVLVERSSLGGGRRRSSGGPRQGRHGPRTRSGVGASEGSRSARADPGSPAFVVHPSSALSEVHLHIAIDRPLRGNRLARGQDTGSRSPWTSKFKS